MQLDHSSIDGLVVIQLWRPSRGGELELIHYDEAENKITQVGDQMYGERGAGIMTLGPPLGMRLGTGVTAAAKTGAGAAAIGTYITASSTTGGGAVWTAVVGGASSLATGLRRIVYTGAWAAGTATNAAITEAVVTNESPVTNVAGTEANTVSRVTFAAVNKQAADTLTITWNHDLGTP